ncbi:hypothetical protein [Streptomyces sp. NBC_00470]|uniref:hypothetical protein n=1 Tax=Streptomyces sp. NBC_00470 TaxID=2975753 RepID=UPI0030DFF7D7
MRIEVDDTRGPGGGRPATLYRFGRKIATRFGRDEDPRLAEGVVLEKGGFERSAGSMQYPQLGPLDGTYVPVHDVPRSVAEEKHLETVDERGADVEALHAERERLLTRLAEIDNAIRSTEPTS